MMFLLLDFIMSFFSFTPTYFVLINMVLVSKKDIVLIIFLGLILDLIVFSIYFLNTLILIIIFIIYKSLKIRKLNLFNYWLSLSSIYFIYIFILGLINHYSLLYIVNFSFKNYGINMIFYLLCYKLVEKHIKLAR